MSFDVVSHFTKTPVDLVIKVADRKLRQEVTLHQRISLAVKDLIELLTFYPNTTSFMYGGTCYQQVFNIALRSPVSAVVANLVMDDTEQGALASAPVPPSLCSGSDMSMMSCPRCPKKSVEILLNHLNSIEPSIQFTVEREMNDCLIILDLIVKRIHHKRLVIEVYRKPTLTDKYLSCDSHRSICHKKSVTRSLFLGAQGIPCSSNSRKREQKYVFDVLKANNYPNNFFKNSLKPVTPPRTNTENENSMMGFVIVPYNQGITEPIKRILGSFNVKVAQKPFMTFGHIFEKLKGRITEQRKDAIYSILCSDCNEEYMHRPDQTSVWNAFKRAPKGRFLFKKRKFSLVRARVPNKPHDCGGKFQNNYHQSKVPSKTLSGGMAYH